MTTVTIVDHTGKGHPDPLYAARLLCFTKNTRMNMKTSMAWDAPESVILDEIKYMATTIPSSWEFADFTFLISDVSRATAQQITRTRVASFAMQSQRVTDMSEVSWDSKHGSKGDKAVSKWKFDSMMNAAVSNYKEAIDDGLSLEDARDLLPIGVHCNLVAKYNLRMIVDLCRKRDSLRVQGPYQDVVQQIRLLVIKTWPWAEPFFVPKQQASIKMIEEVAKALREIEGLDGAVYNGLSGKLAKAADLLKVD